MLAELGVQGQQAACSVEGSQRYPSHQVVGTATPLLPSPQWGRLANVPSQWGQP